MANVELRPKFTPHTARRALGWPLKLLLVLGSLLIIGALFLYVAGRVNSTKWQKYAAQLRAQGEPLTFAEIEALRRTIPEDQNSARVIERLTGQLEDVESPSKDAWVMVFGSRAGKIDFFDGVPRHVLSSSREFLERYRPILDELQALRDKPSGRYHLDLDQPAMDIALPTVGRIRNAGKLIHLQSMALLLEGDLDAAASSSVLLFQLAGSVYDEPSIIGHLVQNAIEAQGVQAVESILRVGMASRESLRDLRAAVERERSSTTPKWGLRGERAFFVDTVEQIIAGTIPLGKVPDDVNGASNAWLLLSRLPKAFLFGNLSTGSKLMSSMIDTSNDPQAMLIEARKIDSEIEKLPFSQKFVRIFFPSLSRTMILHWKSAAQLDCALVALAAEQFRMRTGRLPEALTELVPDDLSAIPTDPFNGEPLRMVKTEKGIIIYSVGDDGVDDGGKVTRDPQLKRMPDVGIRLLKLEHRGIPLTDEPRPAEEE